MLEYLPKKDERIILERRKIKKNIVYVHHPNINNIFIEERENCYLDKIREWSKDFSKYYGK